MLCNIWHKINPAEVHSLPSSWDVNVYRKECQKLETELVDQKDEDKRAALAQLSNMKEKEVDAERQGWQQKIQELLSQVRTVLHNSIWGDRNIIWNLWGGGVK